MLNRLATQAPLQVSFYCLILIPFPLFLLPSHPCHSAQLSIIRPCGPISTCPPPRPHSCHYPPGTPSSDGQGTLHCELFPPSPPATSGIQLLMTVMLLRGEVDRLRIQCLHCSRNKVGTPFHSLHGSPGSGPHHALSRTPTVLQIFWGQLIPLVRASSHLPLTYGSYISFATLPHLSQKVDKCERCEGAELEPSLALPPVLLLPEREPGVATCPACVSQSSEPQAVRCGVLGAPARQGDKCALRQL